MADEIKRRPSAASKRARLDTRAEPDSGALPEPEAILTRGRRRDSTPAERPKGPASARASTPAPRTSARPPRAAPAARSPALESMGPLALRQHAAALQQELTQAQRRIETIQTERGDEADRVSDLLALLSTTEAKLIRAEQAAGTAASGGAAERAAAERLAGELEKERETSAWLRAAGEQATREVATFRARVAEEEVAEKERADARSAAAASAEEVVRLQRELGGLTAELALVRAAETAARGELATASARLVETEHELEALPEARAALDDVTKTAAKLERELEAAHAAADAGREKLEQELRAATADGDARAKKLEQDLGAAKTEAVARTQKLEQELGAAKTEAEARVKKLEQDLGAAKTAADARIRNLEQELKAAHAEAEARLKRLEQERGAAKAEADASARRFEAALEVERSSLAKAAQEADARARTVVSEVDATKGVVLLLAGSLEALKQHEERIAHLRDEAHAARTALSEHTEALHVALGRAAEAAAVRGESKAPQRE